MFDRGAVVAEDLGDAHLVEGNAGGVERGEAAVGVPADSSRDLDRFGDQLAGAGTVTVDRRVHSGRQKAKAKAKARKLPTPCHFQCVAHRGAGGKTRVVPQNLHAVADTRRGRCGCARRRTARSSWPKCNLAEWGFS